MKFILARKTQPFFYMFLLFVVPVLAFGQSKNITGTVSDNDGNTIPGVTVVVVGSTQGTVSDIDGKFSLDVEQSKALRFSYIGFKTQEIEITNQSTLNVVLEIDAIGIEEVVAIGYGTIKKADVTSAVSTVKSKDFIKGAVKDAAQLVQGKVAGLTVATPSGDPTKGSQVMLRGISSLNGGSSPLVIIDGIPGTLETVAPEDIESIDVLKDGSATAIYGTRGTNGVIIITTKSGANGMEPTIEYSGYVSLSQISNKLDYLDADELRQKWNEGYTFTGANFKDYGSNTDWLDEITRDAISNVQNVIFRGGSKSTNLTASINYRNNQGIFERSDNEKYTSRIDINHNMFENKLKANIGLIASEQKFWTGGDGYSFNTTVYRQSIIRNPTEPIKNEDGTWFERDVYNYNNPVGLIQETDGENRYRNMRFTGSLTYSPIVGLDFKGLYARIGNSNIRGFYQTHNHVSTTKLGSNGYASRGTDDYVGNYAELTGSYKKSIGDHRFSALVGYNYEDNTYEGFYQNNKYFPSDAYSYNNIGIGQGLPKGEAGMGSSKSSDKLIALFSRLSYNYASKYMLMLSLRYEGSSRFGENHKWGYFPGVSAGWRINEEDFMSGAEWVDNLKLRAGFGITGINAGSSYQSLSSLNYNKYFRYNGQWLRELIPARNANPNLRWERKEEINVGVDFDLLGGRIGGSFDIYNRTTNDALWNYDVAVPPYLYPSILANVGVIENKGFEALLNVVPVRTNNFEWSTNFTYSTNTNKLVSLSNDQFQSTNDFFYTGYTGEPIQIETHRVEIGGPIGNFYGLKTVDISDDGIWIIETPEGEQKLATESSTTDRQVLGNGLPKHYLSWNNTFRYKGFDLNVNMRGAFGYQILNFQRMFYENPTIGYNTLDSAFDKVYGKAVLSDVQRYVSHYIEDGGFLKITNITLGYSFNVNNINSIKGLRVYASGMSMFTFTNYKGIDPEVNRIGLSPGNDSRDQYPTTRSFTFGVNVTF
jgi:TonB-linked SusC/RagA family outer membrane protein